MAEYVEREQIKKAIHCSGDDLLFIGGKTYIDFEIVEKAVLDTPTADVVEVKHGKWVEGAENFTNGFYEAECSECSNYIRWNEGNSGDWNYCPNCGAKMDGKGD